MCSSSTGGSADQSAEIQLQPGEYQSCWAANLAGETVIIYKTYIWIIYHICHWLIYIMTVTVSFVFVMLPLHHRSYVIVLFHMLWVIEYMFYNIKIIHGQPSHLHSTYNMSNTKGSGNIIIMLTLHHRPDVIALFQMFWGIGYMFYNIKIIHR